MDSQRLLPETASWEMVDHTEKNALFQPSRDPSGIAPIRHPKSYVTILDDYTAKKKITATYQLTGIEGMSHEPTFAYRVIADGMEATGRGRKKQDARQMAARNVLRALSALSFEDEAEDTVNGSPVSPSKATSASETSVDIIIPLISSNLAVSFASPPTVNSADSSSKSATKDLHPEMTKELSKPEPGEQTVPAAAVILYPVPACRADNPVGSLQELTLSIRWPPPRFEPAGREGYPHDATFTLACYVWSYKSLGKGKSKKLAKRAAAFSMYEILKSSQEVIDLWQKRSEDYAKKTNHSRRTKASTIPQRAPPMQNIHKDLMASSLGTVEMLRAMTAVEITHHADPLGFLREIATEVGFDILFEDLYDLSKSSKSHLPVVKEDANDSNSAGDAAASLVILTIPRQIVCFGTGSAKKFARKSAVLNALSYLRTAGAPAFTEKCSETVDTDS